MGKYEKGKVIKVKITYIETYGAFAFVDEKYSGLIHISEISHGYVKDINDFLNIGDTIRAEIIDIDEKMGHLKLSIKNLIPVVKHKKTKKVIIETPGGFKTLKAKLPIWIEKKLKIIKKSQISIDK